MAEMAKETTCPQLHWLVLEGVSHQYVMLYATSSWKLTMHKFYRPLSQICIWVFKSCSRFFAVRFVEVHTIESRSPCSWNTTTESKIYNHCFDLLSSHLLSFCLFIKASKRRFHIQSRFASFDSLLLHIEKLNYAEWKFSTLSLFS